MRSTKLTKNFPKIVSDEVTYLNLSARIPFPEKLIHA